MLLATGVPAALGQSALLVLTASLPATQGCSRLQGKATVLGSGIAPGQRPVTMVTGALPDCPVSLFLVCRALCSSHSSPCSNASLDSMLPVAQVCLLHGFPGHLPGVLKPHIFPAPRLLGPRQLSSSQCSDSKAMGGDLKPLDSLGCQHQPQKPCNRGRGWKGRVSGGWGGGAMEHPPAALWDMGTS